MVQIGPWISAGWHLAAMHRARVTLFAFLYLISLPVIGAPFAAAAISAAVQGTRSTRLGRIGFREIICLFVPTTVAAIAIGCLVFLALGGPLALGIVIPLVSASADFNDSVVLAWASVGFVLSAILAAALSGKRRLAIAAGVTLVVVFIPGMFASSFFDLVGGALHLLGVLGCWVVIWTSVIRRSRPASVIFFILTLPRVVLKTTWVLSLFLPAQTWAPIANWKPTFVGVGVLHTLSLLGDVTLLALPGLMVSALYLFALVLLAQQRMSIRESMRRSRRGVAQDMAGFLGFLLALVGMNVLGAACMGVGILLTIPVTWCAIAAAYQALWPTAVDANLGSAANV